MDRYPAFRTKTTVRKGFFVLAEKVDLISSPYFDAGFNQKKPYVAWNSKTQWHTTSIYPKCPKILYLQGQQKKGERGRILLHLNLSGSSIWVSSSFHAQLFSWQKELHFEFYKNLPATCLFIWCLFCPWIFCQQFCKDMKKVISIFTGYPFQFGPLRNRLRVHTITEDEEQEKIYLRTPHKNTTKIEFPCK